VSLLIILTMTDGEQAVSHRLLISAITGGYQAANRLIKTNTTPAEAGAHAPTAQKADQWIPAEAGMTAYAVTSPRLAAVVRRRNAA
jgi:hypothetical protein